MLNSQEEIRTLSFILSYNEKRAPKMRYKAIAGVFSGVSAFLLLLAFTSMTKTELALVLVSYFIGFATCFSAWRRAGSERWPIVAPHINKESVVERLKQLGE